METKSSLPMFDEMEEEINQCPFCPKICSTYTNLKVHIRIHTGEKPHECKTCSKAFGTSGQLKSHTRIHTGEKPFKCNICDKAFNHIGHLKSHNRIHSGERPYKCPLCKQDFIRSGHFAVHMRMHTGEKPFKCETCSKVYSQSFKLKCHMKTHTHQCKTCKESFSLLEDLQDHIILVHAGEKPFKCNICSKGFVRPGYLERHLKVHEDEEPLVCKQSSEEVCETSKL